MIKYTMQQGSDEWLSVRAGVATASELDAIITPLWTPRKGEGVDAYLCKKLAERWLGQPLATFYGGAMEQGRIREEEAIPYYEFTNNLTIEKIGFIATDDGKFGCSPDGLLPCGGIEVKCPEAHTHCRYLMSGELPKDYAAQVHGSIAVTDADYWQFMSYSRGFPPFILNVKRDEEIVTKIKDAVSEFNIKLDAAYARMVKLNGGEPDRKRFARPDSKAVDPLVGSPSNQELIKEFLTT